MSFLSLRTKRQAWNYGPVRATDHNNFEMNWEDVDQTGSAKFPSKPQYEINRVADLMENIFAELFPLTHAAYEAAGRVAP